MKNEFIKAIISSNIKKNIRDLLVDLSKNNRRKTSMTFLLTKREMCYNKRSAFKKRLRKKKNGKNRNYRRRRF